MDAAIEHALKRDSLIDITTVGRKQGNPARLRSPSTTLMARSILAVCQANVIGTPIWWPIPSSPFT